MPRTIRVVRYRQHGNPAEVAMVESETLPDIGAGEALVVLKLSPINPSDLNMIEGTYAIRPPLPAVGGNEGVGVIAELGAGVKEFKVGQQVKLPRFTGYWREAAVVKAGALEAYPSGLTFAQAATLSVNPLTAWCMLKEIVALQPGDWVVQNAANSGVGLAVIEIARELGLKTLNVVRRAELIGELKAQGADAVVTDDVKLREEAPKLTGGARVKLALNAVGGDNALNITGALGEDGVLVTYGGMAKQPVRLPAGLLIFKGISARGFWVTDWWKKAPQARREEAIEFLAGMMRRGQLTPKIDRMYRIEEAREALARAQTSSPQGKVFFEMK